MVAIAWAIVLSTFWASMVWDPKSPLTEAQMDKATGILWFLFVGFIIASIVGSIRQ